jgi:predicted nucleic-acid-binding Zn-ribbon protein
MKDIVRFGGIKCDNCDYRIEIPFSEYPKWVNKSCPKCGENLLTERDYKDTVRIYKVFNNPIVKFLLQPFYSEKSTRLNIHNGDVSVMGEEHGGTNERKTGDT